MTRIATDGVSILGSMGMHDSTTVAFTFIALVIAGKIFCGLVYASALGIRTLRDRLRQ